MPDKRKPRRVYLDSCVYLSYINQESDKLADIDAIFREADRGETELWTSVVTITEVAFAKIEQDGKLPDAETLAKIDALWTPPAATKLVEFYEAIARDARDLMRVALPQGRKPLKPMDAIHVATAKRLDIPTILTYDDPMLGWDGDVGIQIVRPSPIRPEFPWVDQLGPIEPAPPSAQSPTDEPQ